MAEQIRNLLHSRGRFVLWSLLLLVLAAAVGAAVWSMAGTGAYLTDEGDWQTLAGDYRIGVIDYTVTINGETLMSQAEGGTGAQNYRLVVPMVAGTRFFDSTVTDSRREQEFNEGATLVRVRVVNHSESTVDVSAAFSFLGADGGTLSAPSAAIRALPLPTGLDGATAERLNYRRYVLSTLDAADADTYAAPSAEASALAALEEKYAAYWSAHPAMELPAGILMGKTAVQPAEGDYIQDGTAYYYYKDVFFILWSEYDTGEYNAELTPSAQPRTGQLHAVFTVGQLDN